MCIFAPENVNQADGILTVQFVGSVSPDFGLHKRKLKIYRNGN